MLWRVILPYACFGLISRSARVIDAPPIARWMVGRSMGSVRVWIRGKGGEMERVSWQEKQGDAKTARGAGSTDPS